MWVYTLHYLTKRGHKLPTLLSHVVRCEAVGNYSKRDGAGKGTMVGSNQSHHGILSQVDIGDRVLKQVGEFIHRFLVNQAMLP